MKAGAGLSFSSVRLLSVVLSIFSFICYACMPNGYKNKVDVDFHHSFNDVVR